MTYESIVSKTKETLAAADVSKFNSHLAIQVNITGEGEGIFYIEVKDNNLYVEPYDYYDNDAVFTCDAETFIKIGEGKLDAVAAYTVGKLKIGGSIEKALEFKGILDGIKKAEKSKAKAEKAAAKKKAEPKSKTTKKKAESKAEAKVEVKAEVKPEVKKEAKVEAKPEIKTEVKAEAKPVAKAEPKAKKAAKAK